MFGNQARGALLCLVVVSFPACGPELYWAKQGAQQEEFEQDLISCRTLLIHDVNRSETFFNPLSQGITDDALAQCLNSKGWFLVEKP